LSHILRQIPYCNTKEFVTPLHTLDNEKKEDIMKIEREKL